MDDHFTALAALNALLEHERQNLSHVQSDPAFSSALPKALDSYVQMDEAVEEAYIAALKQHPGAYLTLL